MATDQVLGTGRESGAKGSDSTLAMKSLFAIFGPLMFLCGVALPFLERVPILVKLLSGGEAVPPAERAVISIVIVILSLAMMTIAKSHDDLVRKLDALTPLPGLIEKQGTSQVAMQETLAALSKLPASFERQENGQEAMQETLAILPKLPAFFERQEKRLETATVETNILRTLARIYRQTPVDRIHLRAALHVLQEMHDLNVHYNFRSMEGLSEKKATSANLKHRSLAFLFLKELLTQLPEGGVWFGVTRLTSRKVWTEKKNNEEFNAYRTRMWERVRAHQITVFRIYHFLSYHDFHQMRGVLDDEHDNGVIVRYVISTTILPDMSLLWCPAGAADLERLQPNDINHLTADAMKAKGFLPICGIEFDVKSNEQLNDVEVNDPDSEQFKTLLRNFVEAWSRESKPWPSPASDKVEMAGS